MSFSAERNEPQDKFLVDFQHATSCKMERERKMSSSLLVDHVRSLKYDSWDWEEGGVKVCVGVSRHLFDDFGGALFMHHFEVFENGINKLSEIRVCSSLQCICWAALTAV